MFFIYFIAVISLIVMFICLNDMFQKEETLKGRLVFFPFIIFGGTLLSGVFLIILICILLSNFNFVWSKRR